MTKVTILGQPQGDEPKKKIEFHAVLRSNGEIEELEKERLLDHPSNWANILLLKKEYTTADLDLMYCYGDISNAEYPDPDNCGLYLGFFNDGVV